MIGLFARTKPPIHRMDLRRLAKTTTGGATIAGSAPGFADGPGTAAKFKHLVDVAVDTQGDVYVADTHNGRLRKVTRVSGN